MKCEVIGNHKVCGVPPGEVVDVAETDLPRLVAGGHIRPVKGTTSKPNSKPERPEPAEEEGN